MKVRTIKEIKEWSPVASLAITVLLMLVSFLGANYLGDIKSTTKKTSGSVTNMVIDVAILKRDVTDIKEDQEQIKKDLAEQVKQSIEHNAHAEKLVSQVERRLNRLEILFDPADPQPPLSQINKSKLAGPIVEAKKPGGG